MNPQILDVDISDLEGRNALLASAPPRPPESNEDLVREILLEAGISAALAETAVEPITDLAEQMAIVRAGALLGSIVKRLGDSAAGVALERILFGAFGELSESQREAAKRIGVSHTAIQKWEKKLAEKLTVQENGKPLDTKQVATQTPKWVEKL